MKTIICLKPTDNETSKISWPLSVQMEEWAGLLNIREPTEQYIITHRVFSVSVVRCGLLQFRIIDIFVAAQIIFPGRNSAVDGKFLPS